MKWTGLSFEIVKPDFEEEQLSRKNFPNTAAYVEALSFGKVMSVSERFSNAVIISGDTMIEVDGEVIGKPQDLDHARQILQKLSGREHWVFSGVTIIETKTMKIVTKSVKSVVFFRKLSAEQIETYVQSGEPLGKAGAYGIQSGARPFVDHIEGSWTNVIGLPLVTVCEMLETFDVTVPVNIRAVIEKYLGEGIRE